MATITDDDIIRRKLLIEGDGGNEDRRISNLLKSFIRWSKCLDDDEDSNASYQRMLASLYQCEQSIEKSTHIYNVNLQEQKNYQELDQQIELNIQSALERIIECKKELHQAKRIQRNRQEYDALAKIIKQHPNRQETLSQLQLLDKELEELTKTKESLWQKLELRKKQFRLLITAIHEMQQILECDENMEVSTPPSNSQDS